MKKCKSCSRELPREAFHKCRPRPDGLQTQCIDCQKSLKAEWRKTHRTAEAAACRKWSAKNKDKKKRYRLMRDYGITLEQYRAMYAAQNGKCAICERMFDVLCVDHDHDTTAVRSLLCNNCNTGLGRFREDRYVLAKAIEYLTKHQEE